MADLKPLLPPRIPPSALGQIGDPPVISQDMRDFYAGNTPAPTLKPLIASDPQTVKALTPLGTIAPPAVPDVTVNPLLVAKSSDGLVNRASADSADLYRRSNPAKPTTGLGKVGHVFAGIGNVLGTIFAPAEMAMIHDTQLNNEIEKNRDRADIDTVSGLQTAEATRQDQASQAGEREALARKAEAIAGSSIPTPLTAEEATAIGHPEYEGLAISPRDKAKFFGTTQTNDTRQTVGAGHDDARVAANAATNATRESISDAADKTRTLIAQMRDATSSANNANTNDHKGVSGDGSFKVPADVTKRAALGNNVIENANSVDSLIQQRPDIVGAAGGRYSTVQQMIGSDDPGIAELGVRMHNIALASNGAHGVRSQQAIQQTEDELFRNFKSGPNAIHSALNATRSSMQTFLDDESNFSNTGKRKPSGTAAAINLPNASQALPKNISDAITEGHQATLSDGSIWRKLNGKVEKIK